MSPVLLREPTLCDAAVDLARRGWFVVFVRGITPRPDGRLVCTCGSRKCKSPGKHPNLPKGYQHHPRPDEATIKAHYARHPEDNVGVLTTGLIGIDRDTPKEVHGWRNSADEWDLLQQEHGRAPATLTAVTGSGGTHELYRPPLGKEEVNKLPMLPASHYHGVIDVKAKGGMIVVAPSMHVSGNRYQWVDLDTEIATLPSWLYEKPLQIAPLFQANPKGKPAPRRDRTLKELTALDIKAEELMALRTDPDALLGLATLQLIREGRPGRTQSHVIMSVCRGAASVGYPAERFYGELLLAPGGLGIREAIAEGGEAAGRERFDRAMRTAYLWMAESLDSVADLRAEAEAYDWPKVVRYVGRNGIEQGVRGTSARPVLMAGFDIAENTATTAPMLGVEFQLPTLTGLHKETCLKAAEALEHLGWWLPENAPVHGVPKGLSNAYRYHFLLDPDSRLHPPLQVTPGHILRRDAWEL
jgi:Bifunctional DNA primase/polymerase, N-terminal